jgi:hypothetical protein
VVIALKKKLLVPVAGIPNSTKKKENISLTKKMSSFNSLPSKYMRTERERIGTTKSIISVFTACIVFFQTSYGLLRVTTNFLREL